MYANPTRKNATIKSDSPILEVLMSPLIFETDSSFIQLQPYLFLYPTFETFILNISRNAKARYLNRLIYHQKGA